jgi:predicted alpha/beta hydrolase family esterase
MSNTKHIYLVPRWAGNSSSDWYPWLKQQLESVAAEDGFSYQVHLLDMPCWELPTIEQAVEHLTQVLPPQRLLNEEVYLVGHSVGCLAILHYLSKVANLDSQARVGGVLCVAGWFMVDTPWEDILSWMNAPIDYEKARQLIPEDKLTVLLSDDDPYTSSYQQNEKLWVERLRARVAILPNRQHFSSALDFDVRDSIRDLAGAFEAPLVHSAVSI